MSNAKQIFPNEYAVLDLEKNKAIISSDVEQCIVICCIDDKRYGLAHIKPKVYLDDNFNLNEFLDNFNLEKTKVHVVGGLEDEDKELDGQAIAINKLLNSGVKEENIKLHDKYKEGLMTNVVFDNKGRIEIEAQSSKERNNLKKPMYEKRQLRPETPTFRERLEKSKSSIKSSLTPC